MARLLIILAIVFSFLLNIYFLADRFKDNFRNYYTVTKVIDGDTFEVDKGANVRLFGIDAPELGRCGSQEAKDVLEKLILNKKVRVSSLAKDPYNRKVALVYLDNKLVNNLMIESGWVIYHSSGSKEADMMKTSGENARKNKMGIFSDKCSPVKNDLCPVKGNVSTEDGSRSYYLPECYRYATITVELFRGDQWFCTEKEAQDAGFVRAKVCK